MSTSFIEDPTAFSAISNMSDRQSRYRLADEDYKYEQPPQRNDFADKLLHALGYVTSTEKEQFVSPYTDIISLAYGNVLRIHKLTFSNRFPGSDTIEITSIDDNVIKLNTKIPRGTLTTIVYDREVVV